ncbi:hypothetical protein RSAG8_08023, partial [Rhizoctonia solani AG-8 WAC10335]
MYRSIHLAIGVTVILSSEFWSLGWNSTTVCGRKIVRAMDIMHRASQCLPSTFRPGRGFCGRFDP